MKQSILSRAETWIASFARNDENGKSDVEIRIR
jgi:hypothetical protein